MGIVNACKKPENQQTSQEILLAIKDNNNSSQKCGSSESQRATTCKRGFQDKENIPVQFLAKKQSSNGSELRYLDYKDQNRMSTQNNTTKAHTTASTYTHSSEDNREYNFSKETSNNVLRSTNRQTLNNQSVEIKNQKSQQSSVCSNRYSSKEEYNEVKIPKQLQQRQSNGYQQGQQVLQQEQFNKKSSQNNQSQDNSQFCNENLNRTQLQNQQQLTDNSVQIRNSSLSQGQSKQSENYSLKSKWEAWQKEQNWGTNLEDSTHLYNNKNALVQNQHSSQASHNTSNNTFRNLQQDTRRISQVIEDLPRRFIKVPVDLKGTRTRVKQIYEDGSVYEGQVLNGLRDGQGSFTNSTEGVKYEGEWLAGTIDGYGILYFSNGQIAYEGNWKDNKFNGKGVVFSEKSYLVQEGDEKYATDELIEQFDLSNFEALADWWVKYDGNFENDCKHGLGILYFKNGEKYIGNFIQDTIFGEGAFYRKNGEVILGVWENNVLIQKH